MKLCIATPNKFSYSETFIRNHIEKLKPEFVVNNNWWPLSVSNGEMIFKGLMGIDPIRIAIKNITPSLYQKLYTNAFYKFLVSHNIDTVLAEYGLIGANIMDACKRANCRLVVHFLGFDAFDKKTLLEYSEKYNELFQKAYSLITVSIDMRDQLIKLGAPENKTFVISCGADIKKFSRINELPKDPIVIAVGRFAPKKSPQSTIKAFSKVLQKVPLAKLIMIGDGVLFEDSKKLASELNIADSIDFKGALTPEKIIEEMHKARIFVQHSVVAPGGDSEGLPLALIEAASVGLPIVSTFHAGIPEAVKDKVTGFLVKEHDIDGMANYMIELLVNDELANTMSKAARKHIEDNYDLEKQIVSLRNILISN